MSKACQACFRFLRGDRGGGRSGAQCDLATRMVFRELIQEKMNDLAAKNNYRMENGFQGEQLRGHGEKATKKRFISLLKARQPSKN
jgi:hypothetical protein